MRKGVSGGCTIQIVYMPVFDAIAPSGESSRNQWAVLGLLDGDNHVSRCQVGCGEWQRKTLIRVVLDALLLQARKGIARDRSTVATVECQSARIGDPKQA